MIYLNCNKNFMGLFDDLLGGGAKKAEPTPVTPATPIQDATPIIISDDSAPMASNSGIPMPAVDPVAVMNEQTTSTPPSLDDILSMAPMNPNMPSYTAQKAMESQNPVSESSIVVTETPTIIEATPTMTEISPIITETPVVTENSIQEVSFATMTPAVENTAPIVSEMPLQTENAMPVVGVATQENITTPTSDIFAISETAPVQNEILNLSETPSASENSLFSTMETETPVVENISENPVNIETSENIFAGVAESVTPVAEATPETTSDFLMAGLLQLEKMEKSLAERKNSFLAQAEEYRAEKEKFAALEEKAIADAHSMDDEQARIDAMKAYFKKQQDGASLNDSVNTALAGVAVQNAVGTTIEKKTTRKKTASLV